MKFVTSLSVILFAVSSFGVEASELDKTFRPIYVDPSNPNQFRLFGAIDGRTAFNFKRAVSKYGPPSEILLDSPGGDVHEGLLLALEIQEMAVRTSVTGDCMSACFYVFMAGKNRQIDGRLGVHQMSSASNDFSSGQLAIADMMDVLSDLNVPSDVIVLMLQTPADEMHIFSPQEIMRYGLETVGDAPQSEPAAETAAGAFDFNSDLPPIQRFAAPFENPDEKPLMAIVLMDDGTGGTAGADALSSFPYPVTFAIDASLPNAAEKMARYRASGFEVMALVNLPETSTATDTEVLMSAALAALPEALAVLEGPGTGIQGNREMSDQVTAILVDAGLGLVTQPKGLNTVQKLALRDGVPAATLFRDFGGTGQDGVAIRRYLDQAAHKAGQEGSVIMVGQLRPNTISALLLWGLQDRAKRIALAPVSAVLTAQ